VEEVKEASLAEVAELATDEGDGPEVWSVIKVFKYMIDQLQRETKGREDWHNS
jgi:hypothetical protein